jgi:hypothetical protein
MNRKMRKPDGISAEETPRYNSRASLSTEESVNMMPQLQSALGGMRRKSVLPRAMLRNGAGIGLDITNRGGDDLDSADDSSDEAGVDAFLLGEVDNVRGETKSAGTRGDRTASDSPLTDIDSNGRSSAQGDDQISPLATSNVTDSKARLSTQAEHQIKPRSAVSHGPGIRTSPRKAHAISSMRVERQQAPIIKGDRPPSRRGSVIPRTPLLKDSNGHKRREVLHEMCDSNHGTMGISAKATTALPGSKGGL